MPNTVSHGALVLVADTKGATKPIFVTRDGKVYELAGTLKEVSDAGVLAAVQAEVKFNPGRVVKSPPARPVDPRAPKFIEHKYSTE